MTLYDLWAHGTLLYAQPFAYFSPLVSLGAFIFVVFIITALKMILEHKEQHVLW
ncbi:MULTISPECIES: hypothetical protein [Desulfitobacterium]|uniref:Uncharacterized protein n=2 Tax=Desulfitobacterium dehalogenans TaxID=36854 RepID=I4A7I2_DESDJ|nr:MULTISPECIES: hypothetical protein [Desulfitobacterium]AFL99916.1 hypothetical protein Desde_1503 [Desulfitobacterium dehalogenans ATCC 51507]HHY28255.1 hypothetical protein [Desulfitobacterium dehalogenans]